MSVTESARKCNVVTSIYTSLTLRMSCSFTLDAAPLHFELSRVRRSAKRIPQYMHMCVRAGRHECKAGRSGEETEGKDTQMSVKFRSRSHSSGAARISEQGNPLRRVFLYCHHRYFLLPTHEFVMPATH